METRSRPVRPDYRKIHAKPLPLDIFPLPPLIPHNPFSLLQIAYVYLSQLLFPPCSHTSNIVRGYYSPETGSVHVADAAYIRLLWERGFFGKGSLSRSEPTWLDREKKRLGLLANGTSEQYTQQRREERRKMKTARARRAREAIEEKLTQEKLATGTGGAAISCGVEDSIVRLNNDTVAFMVEEENTVTLISPLQDSTGLDTRTSPTLEKASHLPQDTSSNNIELEIHDEEHLQLVAEEAFFLAYGLGILQVYDQSTDLPMSTSDLLIVFRSYSQCPPLCQSLLTSYDPFLPSYAAYHHFRSLGWVVRPGIKFAVDWLLYLRGPAFSHAEFAVIVLPAFRDAYWRETEQRRQETLKKERRDWWWLHCLQRVQAQVKKGLILCWVEIPPPGMLNGSSSSDEERLAAKTKGLTGREDFDIKKLLEQYKVREMTIRRWIPNRSRD
ncbi:MAG: hypothetical protein Q9163_000506 [Psora crenata]